MKKKRSFLRYSVSIVLTALFLYLAFRGVRLSALWNSLVNVQWTWVALLAAVTILSHLARAWRWQYLLYPVKEKVSLRNSFSGVMIGYMVNNVLPRVGEVVRPYALGNLEGISKSAALGTVVIERILDMITFFMLLLVILFVKSSSFGRLFPSFASFEPLFLFIVVALFVLMVVIFFKAESFFSLLKRLTVILPVRLRDKIDAQFSLFASGFSIANYPGKFFMIFITSLLIWALYTLAMYVPFGAYHVIETHALGFGSATILMVVSTIAFVFPTPSGFGTYHTFTSYALVHLFGIDPVTALSYSVLTHESGFVITTVIGLYYFLHDHTHVAEAVREEV
ncbi:MAG: flippase-like domain-containing protein [Bacteroidota bacterium]|nr:flippase-like domain-containing protein [Bacteroidota bacterium]